MESYDPRKPIIKAKDEEWTMVQGHIRRMLDPSRSRPRRSGSRQTAPVMTTRSEGHFKAHLDPDVIARATGTTRMTIPRSRGTWRIR